jgi:hypothetical protein
MAKRSRVVRPNASSPNYFSLSVFLLRSPCSHLASSSSLSRSQSPGSALRSLPPAAASAATRFMQDPVLWCDGVSPAVGYLAKAAVPRHQMSSCANPSPASTTALFHTRLYALVCCSVLHLYQANKRLGIPDSLSVSKHIQKTPTALYLRILFILYYHHCVQCGLTLN